MAQPPQYIPNTAQNFTVGTAKTSKRCVPCAHAHTACDGKEPCERCIRQGITSNCFRYQQKPRGRPRNRDRPILAHATPLAKPTALATTTTANASPAPQPYPSPDAHPAGSPPGHGRTAPEQDARSAKDQLSSCVILRSIKIMDSRIRQLEDDNKRLKKRQRKTEKEAEQLRTFISSQLMPLLQKSRPIVPVQPSFSSGMSDTSMPTDLYIHFPFLREYDMTNRRFVAHDLRKPLEVMSFGQFLKIGVAYANSECCQLSGFSLEEMNTDLVASMPIRDKTKFLNQVFGSSMTPMGISDPLLLTIEYVRKDGSFLRFEFNQQVFYGSNAQPRCAIACVERVLEYRPPLWQAEGGSSDLDENERSFRLLQLKDSIRKQENEEWTRVSQMLGYLPRIALFQPESSPLLSSPSTPLSTSSIDSQGSPSDSTSVGDDFSSSALSYRNTVLNAAPSTSCAEFELEQLLEFLVAPSSPSSLP